MQIFNFLVATLKKGKGKEQEKLIKNVFYLTQIYKKIIISIYNPSKNS